MYKHCSKCKDGWVFNEQTGTATKCDCLKSYQELQKFLLNQSKAEINDFNLTFGDYKGQDSRKNIEKLKRFLTDDKYSFGSHLYFFGKNGTQKSTVAKIVLSESLKLGKTGLFILMNDLMDLICNPFADEKTLEKINYAEVCDLLVVDDCFSAKKITLYKNSRDYQMSFLDSFLRRRLEKNKKNTIFTANVEISNVEKNGFSYDIQNLLEREIKIRKGELIFEDVYIDSIYDVDILSLWD